MKGISGAIGVLMAIAASSASAQPINLTGAYRCVQACQGGAAGSPAYITQNGAELNLLNEIGMPSRAWPDWFAPLTRIWVERYNYGAVYAADGMTIQFDNGTIWQRDLGLPLQRRF